ncbi:universal stress protein [Gilvimarinus sp. F26214L]|uniref:universal stress protein n=1 Tax=Gilvimarinus sp. DZF01 TaxID=3461371 RepID=UPI0040461DDD
MINTIVFATDLGVYTPYIVQHVMTFAKNLQARVVVVHAVEPLGSLGTAMVKTYLPAEKTREFQQQGMSVLISTIRDRLVDMLADEYIDNDLGLRDIPEVVVEAGRPAEIILAHAARTQADMIVMGSHGPDLDRAHLGSVTNKVLQLTRIPVYMVPVLAEMTTRAFADESDGAA